MATLDLEVEGRTLSITHPERILFADCGVTKGEVARYYQAVGPGILRALWQRPTMLERYPDGIEGERFYSKRVPRGAPNFVHTSEITFPSGRTADEIRPDSLATILWCVQMGTLPFHPWPVRAGDVDHPDELRIDLDPQPGTGFVDAVNAARGAKQILDAMDLVGYPKTSGSRGVHIFVRIKPEFTFPQVRAAALAFGRILEQLMPHLVTTTWQKSERGKKVFCDYNQNARDRTVAAAWSVRPKAGAPVSMPLTWEQLFEGVDPAAYTVRTVPELFAESGDPHADIDQHQGSIRPLVDLADEQSR